MSEYVSGARAPSAEEIRDLGEDLGVSSDSLRALGVQRIDGARALGLRGAGFCEGRLPEYAWVFPELAANRDVVGLSLRAPDGRKGFIKGGKRGLVIPERLATTGPEIFVVEGASDAAALHSLGLPVVGRPSNNGGADQLAEFLSEYERVIILGEYDPKPNGKWPGWDGAVAVAGKLARTWRRTVYFAMPPRGSKDVRTWLQARRSEDPDAEFHALGEELLQHVHDHQLAAEPEGLRVVCMDDVEAKPIRWLWEPWLPSGKLVLKVGDAGVGKSILLSDLIARITSGSEPPDGGSCFEPVDVLMFCAEDDPGDTIKPRLLAANADCSRVHFCPVVDRKDGEGLFDLTKDLPHLERELDEKPDTRVVVIDPVLSYTGDAQTNSHTEVRRITNALTKLAMERDLLIIGVMHLNKNEEASVLTRVVGSGAWVQASRLALAVGEHPDDDECRVLMPFKSNFGHDGGGMVFKIEKRESDHAARVVWLPDRFHGEPEDLVRHGRRAAAKRNKLDEAKEWLDGRLAGEPAQASVIAAEAHGAGHSPRTIERAAGELGVRKSGGPGSTWSLPEAAS